VHVDPPDALPGEPPGFDESHCNVVIHERGARQRRHEREDLAPAPQVAARQFVDHERVGPHVPAVEPLLQQLVASAEVVDPDGGINQHRSASPPLPAPRDCLQGSFGPPEIGQPPRALSRNESLKPGVKDCRLLVYPAQSLGLPEKGVVDVECGPHMHNYVPWMQTRQGRPRRGDFAIEHWSVTQTGFEHSKRGIA